MIVNIRPTTYPPLIVYVNIEWPCIAAWKRVLWSLHTTKDKISFTTPVLLGKKQKIAQGIQVNNFRHCLKRQSGYLHSATCFVLYMQFSRKIAERIFNKQDWTCCLFLHWIVLTNAMLSRMHSGSSSLPCMGVKTMVQSIANHLRLWVTFYDARKLLARTFTKGHFHNDFCYYFSTLWNKIFKEKGSWSI